MQRLTFKNTLSCQKLDKKIAAVAETTDGRTDRCIKCQNRTAAFPTPNLSAIVARTVYELHSRCVSFYSPQHSANNRPANSAINPALRLTAARKSRILWNITSALLRLKPSP